MNKTACTKRDFDEFDLSDNSLYLLFNPAYPYEYLFIFYFKGAICLLIKVLPSDTYGKEGRAVDWSSALLVRVYYRARCTTD